MHTAFGPGWLAIVTWVFTALLLLLAIVSTLAARGSIRRNFFLGIRMPQLQRSDVAWRAGHSAAVLPAWIGFSGAFICAIVGIFVPPVHWGVVALFVATAVWTFVVAVRAADAVTQ